MANSAIKEVEESTMGARPASFTPLPDALLVGYWNRNCTVLAGPSMGMMNNESLRKNGPPKAEVAYCEESRRLLDAFAGAVRELALLHEEQFKAILNGDGDASRFDLLIHVA